MPKVPKLKYSQENLQKAIAEVQNNVQQLSDRQISQKYGIPRSTLRFYKRNPGHKTSLGPSPILTSSEESVIEGWLITSARKGFPKNKDDVLDSVQKFLIDNPRPNPFTNKRPGIGWWKAFLKRHPKLSIRTSEGVTKASSCVSEKDIRGWFDEIRSYAEEKGFIEALSQPNRVFNADETNFQICLSSGLVIAEKGSKNVYNIEHSNAKESITVLFTFSAAGDVCCPFIVYPYQRLPEKICESIPEGWGIGKSDNGWMTTEVFYEFIANVFHPYLVSKSVEFPVILYVDGHKTHLNYHLSQLCTHLQIELIALYPNATRIIQPADVSAFRPLKMGWRKYLKKWQLSNQNKGITKLNFAPILYEVVTASLRPDILINGFRTCGLCPFNPDSINYSKCLGKNTVIQPESSKGILDNATITYETFRNITGLSLCKSFEDESFNTTDKHLAIIYKLWREFQNNSQTTVTSVGTLENEAQSNTSQSLNFIDNTDKSQTILNPDSNNKIAEIDAEQIIYPVEVPPAQLITIPSTSKTEHTPYYLHSLPGTSNCDQNIFLAGDSETQDFPEFQSDLVTPDSATILESPKLVKIKSTFGEYLVYPKTPIRKGKRQVERQPFAITSTKFKLAVKKKQTDKESQLKEKEQKKMEREVKKNEKSKKEFNKLQNKDKLKTQTTRSQPGNDIVNDIPDSGREMPESKRITVLKEVLVKSSDTLCAVCKRFIIKNKVECSSCHQSFHSRCIPEQHKSNIPDDADMLLFLCHFCYKINDSDDTNSDCEELYLNVQKARRDLNF